MDKLTQVGDLKNDKKEGDSVILKQEQLAAALLIANKELVRKNKEVEKQAAELISTNQDLAFQIRENAKQTEVLVIANAELALQNNEKEKQAQELVIANAELAFQNVEKEKRAEELRIANKELAFQNNEKEKRAQELAIVNAKLSFQNKEKKKRAPELININKELAYQILEKEKRTVELEAANKELESFSYSVSHDLRAPLRAINGFTQVLVEDYSSTLGEDAKVFLDEIIANSHKMGQLIDNLLQFSRISKLHFSLDKADIGQIVNTVIKEIRQLEPNRNINIILNDLPPVKGDKHMLKQVFMNLISNALKYTSKKSEPEIEIGAKQENDSITYFVKDNGAGFDMRYADKLFGVFQRLHSSNEFEGNGVGLAIIHKIISKHNGEVWAEGKVNEGACFYISLPV